MEGRVAPVRSVSAVRWLVIGGVSLALVALGVSFAMEEEPSLAEFAVGGGIIVTAIVALGALLELAVRRLPRRTLALVLGATLLPALGSAAALGLPESLIHYSGQAEWAFTAGREVSVGALVVAAATSLAVARGCGTGLMGMLGVALLTLVLATVGRDLGVRELDPGWCYADQFSVGPNGGFFTSGTYDRCTVLLPAKDPLAGSP